jgi:hypothetical protein
MGEHSGKSGEIWAAFQRYSLSIARHRTGEWVGCSAAMMTNARTVIGLIRSVFRAPEARWMFDPVI